MVSTEKLVAGARPFMAGRKQPGQNIEKSSQAGKPPGQRLEKPWGIAARGRNRGGVS